jgi:hypothetical protein
MNGEELEHVVRNARDATTNLSLSNETIAQLLLVAKQAASPLPFASLLLARAPRALFVAASIAALAISVMLIAHGGANALPALDHVGIPL